MQSGSKDEDSPFSAEQTTDLQTVHFSSAFYSDKFLEKASIDREDPEVAQRQNEFLFCQVFRDNGKRRNFRSFSRRVERLFHNFLRK